MGKGKKFVGIVGAVVFGAGLGAAPDALAFERAVDARSKQALAAFLEQHPTSEYATEAVGLMMERMDATEAGSANVDPSEVGISGY